MNWYSINDFLDKLILCSLITIFFIIWIIGAIVTVDWFILNNIKEFKKESIQKVIIKEEVKCSQFI